MVVEMVLKMDTYLVAPTVHLLAVVKVESMVYLKVEMSV